MKNVVIIDTETTGLDPRTHEIIEIGAVVCDVPFMSVTENFSVRIRPVNLAVASPEALRLNGYSESGWQDSETLGSAMEGLTEFLRRSYCDTIIGHNLPFDWGFLDVAWAESGVARYEPRRKIDSMSILWPMLALGHVKSLSLDSLCIHYRVVRPAPHRALNDAKACASILGAYLMSLQHGGF